MSDQGQLYAFPVDLAFLHAEAASLMGLGWPECPHEGGVGTWAFWRNPLTGRGVWTNSWTGRVRAHKETR